MTVRFNSALRALLTASFPFVLAAGTLGQAPVSASSAPPAKEPVPANQVPQYDVISIKPNKSGSGNISVHVDDGNYDATNITLKGLIADASNIKQDLIAGLPGWATSAHFDIKAKILEPDKKVLGRLTPEQWRSMLLPMLDRFHLKYHIEVKTLPIYELTVAKGGPKFAKSSSDANFNGVGSGGTSVQNTHLTAHDVNLQSLVSQLSYSLHRTVVDRTGLKDKYDLDLRWTPDDSAASIASDANRSRSDNADTPPVLVTALQEQLGLKLVSSKGPVDTLVVDSIDLPTEN